MKMDSSPIVMTSPLLVDASLSEPTGPNPAITQAIAALGDPSRRRSSRSGSRWSSRCSGPQIADTDLFLPEKGRPLRGVRDARAGAGLLATLNAVWGSIATRGLMPVTPTLLPGDAAAGRGSTMSTPVFSGKSLEGFLVVQRQAHGPAFTIAGSRRARRCWPKGWAACCLAAARACRVGRDLLAGEGPGRGRSGPADVLARADRRELRRRPRGHGVHAGLRRRRRFLRLRRSGRTGG